jgi:transposase
VHIHYQAVYPNDPESCSYDSDEIVDFAKNLGIKPVIPPRSNRKIQRYYDKHLYKTRHLVENAFLKMKQWRGIATRYAKKSESFEQQFI